MAPKQSDPSAWLETIAQANDATIRADPRGTIVPPKHPVATAGRQAYEVLQRLADGRSTHDRLEYTDTLGEGGMGVVRLANQQAIGRKVAVKSLRPDRRDDETTLALLREAWITGGLEHPNIVPVYSLGLDEDGLPIIVLKRIEGVVWDDLIDDADEVRERFGEEDLLEWNLKILLQVIDAIRFAHSRGIIHRDLKPDNVMIGEFGEVYVLDWGIAVSLRDDGSGRLPLARDATEMAGTPVYMAPEMLGNGEPLSKRTDIYLLGAILCEILSGAPPHDGDSAMEILASVARSEPALPTDAPAELVRICHRAMDADPNGRFERVEQLRLALRAFLQHRDSLRLTAVADARRRELDAALREASSSREDHERIYELFGEARFGFRQALTSWSANDTAHAGLRRATISMIQFELGQNDPRAAQRLLKQLDQPPPDLIAEVDAALAADEADKQRIARLEELGRDLDFAVGARTRTFLSAIVGGGVTGFPFLVQYHSDTVNWSSHTGMILWTFVLLLMVSAFGFWARESMMKTAINRRITASIILLLIAQMVLFYGAEMTHIDVVHTQVIMLFLWFVSCAMTVIAIDRRFLPSALGYVAVFLLAARNPENRWFLAVASNALLTVNAVYVWRPPKGEWFRRTERELSLLRAKRDDRR